MVVCNEDIGSGSKDCRGGDVGYLFPDAYMGDAALTSFPSFSSGKAPGGGFIERTSAKGFGCSDGMEEGTDYFPKFRTYSYGTGGGAGREDSSGSGGGQSHNIEDTRITRIS